MNKLFNARHKLEIKVFFKYLLWNYIVVIVSVLLCSFIFNRWVEGISFCVAHCIMRYKFRYVYHSNNHCLELTLFIIWCVIPHTVSLSYSLLSTIFDGFVICYIGCVMQEKIALAIKVHKQKTIDKKPFDIENCSKEELIIRCKELRLSAHNTELAVAFFIDKTKQSILAERLCIDEKSVAQQKFRLKQKLVGKNNDISNL